jgi:hypothetical protein
MLTVSVNTSQWDAALKQYLKLTSRTMKEVLNQRAFNIARNTIGVLPPSSPDQKRAAVRAYLSEKLSEQKMKIATSGKRKGKAIVNYKKQRAWNLNADQKRELTAIITRPRRQDPRKAYPRNNFQGNLEKRIRTHANRAHRLERVNLIIQARRAAAGIKGLYGYEMFKASERFKRFAATSVTYLQVPFAWTIRKLAPLVRYKAGLGRLLRISTWPGSTAAKTEVTPGGAPWSPNLLWKIALRLRGPRLAQAKGIVMRAMQVGVDTDALDMEKRVRDDLQRVANKFNARPA